MAGKFTVLFEAQLSNASDIQKQLDKLNPKVKISTDIDTGNAEQQVRGLVDAGSDLGLTYQEANAIMSESIKIISSMVDQVFELDGALTEFKKVSDLSGSSLDAYVDKLSALGSEVGRTGKPKCLSLSDGMVNQH